MRNIKIIPVSGCITDFCAATSMGGMEDEGLL